MERGSGTVLPCLVRNAGILRGRTTGRSFLYPMVSQLVGAGPREIARMMVLASVSRSSASSPIRGSLIFSVVGDLVATATEINMFWVYLAIPVGCGSLALIQVLEFLTRSLGWSRTGISDAGASLRTMAFLQLRETDSKCWSGLAFFVLLFLGSPVGIALCAAGIAGLLIIPDGAALTSAIPEQILRSLNSFPFLTIPLFIFAGVTMAEGGVAKRLMALAEITVGRGRGGLGSAVVLSTLFFHGISGSSTADTAAIAKVTLAICRLNATHCRFRRRCSPRRVPPLPSSRRPSI